MSGTEELRARESALLASVERLQAENPGTVQDWPEPVKTTAWDIYAELRDIRSALEIASREAERAIVRANTAEAIAAGEVFTAKNGYGGALTLNVRPMFVDEAKRLGYGDHVLFLDNAGNVRRAKVNGQPKTWKRDASRVEVPLKYGLYEYWRDYGMWNHRGIFRMVSLVVDTDGDGTLYATI